MDFDDIVQMLDLMERNGLVEVEWERDGTRVRLRKPDGSAAADQRLSGATATPADPGRVVVQAPILGTFYRSSGPDASPFVSVGDRVSPGDVLCIIEAMKLMNEIKSDVDGEILEVFVESGKPVQYGERLFAIRTQPVG
jgi:acetyl-CoA carboxylase biotin carboxyl carrier protein